MAYQKETSVIDALVNIVNGMESYIQNDYDYNSGKLFKRIPNPVNPEENFADKWIEHPKKEQNFYKWIIQVKQDVQHIIQQRGLHNISDAMKKPFGDLAVTKTFSTLGEKSLFLRQSGNMKMNTGSGILSSVGTVITPNHNFHGKD